MIFFIHIIKALNPYRKKTGTDNRFWIHLDKKVPTGAGLSGGSSDAATALWVANQFSGCPATEKELQEWSSEIGSNIPFFFSHGTTCCTGRGEIVQDIPSLVPLDKKIVLIKPPPNKHVQLAEKFTSNMEKKHWGLIWTIASLFVPPLSPPLFVRPMHKVLTSRF
ncbi:hypothetical protein OIU84_008519 [Salix udensis]|uniref:GHMP kinase N-terminal domain-containing protein n=1 Tax=Salix udensis TaxID=889485 RepID=A0AAD6JPD7_9ROSI|nr:hypothetical protein OIU84_008519 [Salix udensis]